MKVRYLVFGIWKVVLLTGLKVIMVLNIVKTELNPSPYIMS